MMFSVHSRKFSKVLTRMKSWVNPKTFKPSKVRGILLGVILTVTLGEVCVYKLLQQDMNAGDLPAYTADLVLTAVAVFEAVASPLVAWWGSKSRRRLLIGYAAAVSLVIISWLFMPGYNRREESAFCKSGNATNSIAFRGMSARAAARLVMALVSAATFVVARVATWSHGIAYCDEFAPDRTSVHYGVLLIARALPLIMGYKLLTNDVDKNLAMQVAWLTLGNTPNILQCFFFIPKADPVVKGVQKNSLPDKERSFLASFARVCANPLAISQMFAMGLLSAALFGYMFNEIDVVKVKFNLVPENNAPVNIAQAFQLVFIIFAIALAGHLFSKPIWMEYRSAQVMKQITMATSFAVIIYMVMTLKAGCDHGYVAGLTNDLYSPPQCSISCGCKPRWKEFEPVCVVDTMTTYVSPCQAGCGAEEFLHGIRVYTNCTCSESGRAVVGACSDTLCKQAHKLHGVLLVIAVTFTLLALQGQGLFVLRAVDPRDKSVAMGMSWSAVALLTYVCGHLLFTAIRVGTCRWFEKYYCHLQTSSYAHYVGCTCAVLAFLSLLISIISIFSIRRANNKENTIMENTRL